jgi:hypothetical protein
MTTRFVRKPALYDSNFSQDTVVLDETIGAYFGIGGVGVRLWALLIQPHTIDQLCRVITEEFEISAEECQSDVSEFIDQLSEAGLLEPAPQA